MKLIDLLVQELPKRGGWPGAIPALVQNSSGYIYQAGGGNYLYFLRLADDWMNAEVTCEKYFDALRASSPRPGSLLQYGTASDEWDGVGLPPLGVDAEVSVDGGRTWCSYKAVKEHNGMRLVEIGDFTEEFQSNNWSFRPIRSEADKKRDEAIAKIIDAICGEIPDTGMATAAKYAARAYDAIAAGKIPGVRIE